MASKILIFIPARNESGTLAKVIDSSFQAVKNCVGSDPEALVIDDGSTDNTASIAKEHRATVKRHERSRGLGNVFSEAVEYAIAGGYDIMLTVDGDGQFSAEDIPNLLNPILSGRADFVTGSRFVDGSSVLAIPGAKKLGNKAMSKIISSILGQNFRDVSCGFRAYSRESLIHLNMFGAFTYTQEVFLNLGIKNIRIQEVPINVKYFKERRSRIAHSLLNYAVQTSKIIFRSVIIYRPMRLFGFLSAICLALGLPTAIILGIRYILTDLITPFKGIGITALVLIVLGLTFLIAGITLEILSRMQISIERAMYYARKRS